MKFLLSAPLLFSAATAAFAGANLAPQDLAGFYVEGLRNTATFELNVGVLQSCRDIGGETHMQICSLPDSNITFDDENGMPSIQLNKVVFYQTPYDGKIWEVLRYSGVQQFRSGNFSATKEIWFVVNHTLDNPTHYEGFFSHQNDQATFPVFAKPR